MMTKHYIFIVLLIFTLPSFSQKERKFVREGNKLYENEKYEESEVAYRKALEKKPNSIEAQYNLAGTLYKQKKYEESANSYSTITGSAKNNEELSKYYHNLGNSYLQAGKLQESIEAYKNALRNNSKDEETRYNLAFAMDKLKQQQQQQQQQKENKDNKDDQEQQQQKENKDNKDDQQQQQQQQQQEEKKSQPKETKISKEDAERMLEAIMNEEKETQKKVKEQQMQQVQTNIEKDW